MFVLLLPDFSVQALSVDFPQWEMRIQLPFLHSLLLHLCTLPRPPYSQYSYTVIFGRSIISALVIMTIQVPLTDKPHSQPRLLFFYNVSFCLIIFFFLYM